MPVGASSKNAMVPMTMVNTKNILFICGGAFPELEEIIKERLNQEASIGFRAKLKDEYDKDEKLLSKVTVEDAQIRYDPGVFGTSADPVYTRAALGGYAGADFAGAEECDLKAV